MSDEAIARIEKKIDELRSHLGIGAKVAAKPPTGGAVADDADLDGQWGDPEVRKDPPRWTGRAYAPCRMSETEPAYLEALAGFLDWKAGKADEEGKTSAKGHPVGPMIRKDAARARGWAARLSRGAAPAKPEPARMVPEWGKPAPASQGDAYEDPDGLPFLCSVSSHLKAAGRP